MSNVIRTTSPKNEAEAKHIMSIALKASSHPQYSNPAIARTYRAKLVNTQYSECMAQHNTTYNPAH
ncbi:hypothetical protein VCO01S_01010 [Vibrio comitans NBRC 102076]|uniref:Uncharacterized protein n=1 Tax=Vibrio comitans NBRC 102076 TaxID=1219078 RepID=A0A4Y3IIX2_9VIBR|nr:hypothetical protein VCO01S_01010 [Vibrio comitans NBRC 102076]